MSTNYSVKYSVMKTKRLTLELVLLMTKQKTLDITKLSHLLVSEQQLLLSPHLETAVFSSLTSLILEVDTELPLQLPFLLLQVAALQLLL